MVHRFDRILSLCINRRWRDHLYVTPDFHKLTLFYQFDRISQNDGDHQRRIAVHKDGPQWGPHEPELCPVRAGDPSSSGRPLPPVDAGPEQVRARQERRQESVPAVPLWRRRLLRGRQVWRAAATHRAPEAPQPLGAGGGVLSPDDPVAQGPVEGPVINVPVTGLALWMETMNATPD